MKIYTKNGDGGKTTLMSSSMKISKSDDRFEALGTIDELTSSIGLIKAVSSDKNLIKDLEREQSLMITLMAGIAAPRDEQYQIPDEEITFLEDEIDTIENSFERPKMFILPGKCELSARIDVARTICRRAERCIVKMDFMFPARPNVKKYINRLADWLYILARRADYDYENNNIFGKGANGTVGTNEIIGEVVKNIEENRLLSLSTATKLISEIEKRSAQLGKKSVIAVVNSEGNPIAVHVMDGAFLVSFEVAVKKAYTAAALKTDTLTLSKLIQPGQTFYGLQNMDKLVILGGGIPLKVGDLIVGGLGVSGGTAEEDAELACYGAEIFKTL